MRELVQAVIDDDFSTVDIILDFDPLLLKIEPSEFGITEVESQLTWQRFKTENVFIMAQKLHRLKIMETMLPHFEKLEQARETKCNYQDLQTEVMQQWIMPSFNANRGMMRFDKLQEEYIETYFLPLINTIAEDKVVGIDEHVNANTVIDVKTELELEAFRKKILPNEAVAIDNYVDIEVLYIAANKAFDLHDKKCNHWGQKHIYTQRVIGFIQTLLSPEPAMIYIGQGIYPASIVQDVTPQILKLRPDNRSMYRSSRSDRSHIGFNAYIQLSEVTGARPSPIDGWKIFKERYLFRQAAIDKLKQQVYPSKTDYYFSKIKSSLGFMISRI